MTDFPAAERILHKSVSVSAPVEDVWWAWTTDAGIRSWLVDDSRVELRVGGPYEWYFLSEAEPGNRGSEDCQVIGFQAPTMLTFTWNAPPHLTEARAQRTVVLLRLRPDDADEGTRVELTQLGMGRGRGVGRGLRLLRPRVGRRPARAAGVLRRRGRAHGGVSPAQRAPDRPPSPAPARPPGPPAINSGWSCR